MESGDLRHKVEVWGKVPGENEIGEKTLEDGLIRKIWSNIIPQTGKLQNAQLKTLVSSSTHKIEVRYNSGKFITEEMTIKYKDHKFDIKYILNPKFKNEKLEIFVEEVMS